MGIISNLLGNTPIATSAMKGAKTGDYGQSGIVGTILKMYLGGALGGAMGGAEGAGASGLEGAANGISGTTSNLFGNGLQGFGDAITGTGGNGDVLGTALQGVQSGNMDWGKLAGNVLQDSLRNGSNYANPQQSQHVGIPQMKQQGVSDMMQQINSIGQQAGPGWGGQQQQSNPYGIPDFMMNMFGGAR